MKNPKFEIRNRKEARKPNQDYGCSRFGLLPSFVILLLLSTLNSQLSTALAQGTAFTYQGRLADAGSPAGGTYDLTFSIWSAPSGPLQIDGTVTNAAVTVSNGLFTLALHF